MSNQDFKSSILLKFIEDNIFKSFSNENLERFFSAMGKPQEACYLYFPYGVESVADDFFDYLVRDFITNFDQKRLKDLGTTAKVSFLVMEFFKQYRQYQPHIEEMLKNRKTIKPALRASYNLANEIWYLSNDKATDYNFYTKRLLLQKLIIASFRVWLTDTSKNLAKTQEMLENQLQNIVKFAKFKSNLKGKLEKIFDLPFIRLLKKGQ